MALPERQLIERIRRRSALASPAGLNRGTVLGIGDDCALLQVPPGRQLLVTTDMCVEDVHFRRDWHPASSVGHRCLARGLSDIAAMGGEPIACFLSLALPQELPQRWVDGFITGLLKLARRFSTGLAGGDISTALKVTVDIVVVGKVPVRQAVLRSTARPGDRIYVTGRLGESAADLRKLMEGKKVAARLSSRHFYPMPRLEAGAWLRQKKLAHAMIDVSDGLSVDLAHLCQASNLDAIVEEEALRAAHGTMGSSDLDLVLHGGEDYELLFTAPATAKIPPRIGGVPVTLIGEMTGKLRQSTEHQKVWLRDLEGRLAPL